MKRLADINLIPETENKSPDYYCTWQSQLYACSDKGPQGQRDHMTEHDLFGTGDKAADFKEGIGFITHQYPDARRDLFLIMDDSWDVPIGGQKESSPWYGSLMLARDKFPEAFGIEGKPEPITDDEPLELELGEKAMKRLAQRVESLGWRGLGGWVCLQKSPLADEKDDESYWSKRICHAVNAGWKYWKVDWGRDCGNARIRALLTKLKNEIAPDFIVEQAMKPELIGSSDVFRSYDAFTLMAIPLTLERLSQLLMHETEPGYGGLINCEDEPYTAAALGCALGVMRHGMLGNLPDGHPDASFPAMHRSFKTKLAEVTRCVRWHRIAPAFAVSAKATKIDTERLCDNWTLVSRADEIEAWWGYHDGDRIEKSAPARISRGLELASVKPDSEGELPYVISSMNPEIPNVASIATLGRTRNHEYCFPLCEVSQDVKNADTVGAFGFFGSLTLKTAAANSDSRVYMQDLAGDTVFDVTDECAISDGELSIPGELITKIGQSANPDGDTSEPGVVVKIVC